MEIRCKSSGSQHAEKTRRTRVIHVDYMWKLGVKVVEVDTWERMCNPRGLDAEIRRKNSGSQHMEKTSKACVIHMELG